MTSHRTTSATPVSHVFPGRRRGPQMPGPCSGGNTQQPLRSWEEHVRRCQQEGIVPSAPAPGTNTTLTLSGVCPRCRRPLVEARPGEWSCPQRCTGQFWRPELVFAPDAPRGPYKVATCPTSCRTHPDCVCAAYGALEGRQRVVDGLVRFTGDLVVYLGKLEARLRALEVSGEGERG